MSFKDHFQFGADGEDLIFQWIRLTWGMVVTTTREFKHRGGGGPAMFQTSAHVILPDLIAFSTTDKKWVEVKRKSAWMRYRAAQRWETGMDTRLWENYKRVADVTGIPVWILFFHDNPQPSTADLAHDGCPESCPTGLYGGDISTLPEPTRCGKPVPQFPSGSVNWCSDSLPLLASVDEVLRCSPPPPPGPK